MKNNHNLKTGSSIERSDERIKETQEVFTPLDLVDSMVNDIPEDILKDPSSTFIDPSAGSGNFLVRATTVAAVIFFVTSLSLAIFARNNSGVGATTGLPVVDQQLLEETISTQSDVPQIEDNQPVSNQGDLPSLPDNN